MRLSAEGWRWRCAAAALLIASAGALAEEPVFVDAKFELFVSQPEEALRFYRDLGFQVAQRKSDGYTTLRSGSTVIALSPIPWWLPLRWLGFLRHPPLGTEIVLYTGQLEALRGGLEAAGWEPGPIRLQPWGDRDFRVTDPEGYYVRVSEGRALPRGGPAPGP